MASMINRERTNDLMRSCGLDGVIVASPANVTYSSDYSNWLDGQLREWMVQPSAGADAVPTLAVVDPEGVSLVIDALFEPNATDLSLADVVTYGRQGQAGTPIGALRLALERRGLADADLGLEVEALTGKRHLEVRNALPAARLRDCSQLLRLVRAVKSSEELDRLRRAAEVNETAFTRAFADAATEGGELQGMARRFAHQLAQLDAVIDHFAYGVGGRGIATNGRHRIRPGDALYVDFGCRYRSAYADSGTTVAVGRLDDELAAAFAALRAAIDEGAQALSPGAKCSEVYAAMRPAAPASGAYVHGHSLGVEMRDLPLIVEAQHGSIEDDCVAESADLRIEPDMVINIEAPLFLPGRASLHLEQTFVVTETGAEPLIEQPRDHPLVLKEAV